MPSALIYTGILFLCLAAMGTRLLRNRPLYSPVRQLLSLRRFLQQVLRLLHTTAQQTDDAPLQTLRTELMYLRQHIGSLASLPCGESGWPRILLMARELPADGSLSPEIMRFALENANHDLDSTEIAAFPFAAAFSQAEKLSAELRACRTGKLDPGILREHLWQHADIFNALRHMDWLESGEQADPLHALLMHDPSETYARMDAASRLSLRLEATRFARRMHQPAEIAVHQALSLCTAAGHQELQSYVGYWLQDPSGMLQLRRSLGVRSGWLYTHLAPRKELCRYMLRWLLGGIAGFSFLQTGHPVFMLPFFAVCAGTLAQQILHQLPDRPLSTLMSPKDDTPFRTLVVLPVLLQDPFDAFKQVERLCQVSRVCGHNDVDFLLLADVPDHITAVSATDSMTAAAALEALSAKNDGRFLFLQRGRSWNDEAHIYHCRGESCGALQELCRLIVRGESLDPIACCNIDLAAFERRYAYVFSIPENRMIREDTLEKLLGAATHPMNARYPVHNGWRGYGVLSPANCDPADGCWLLRPDAFLEATEDYIDPSGDAKLLCSELAGHADVCGALAADLNTHPSWDVLMRRSGDAWRLLPWQFPWVRTPAGIIKNPLGFFARFRLRDRMREAALPASQIILLIWALLTRSWPLLVLALLAPNLPPIAGRTKAWFIDLLSLPTQAAVSTAGMLSPWIRRLARLPAEGVLELWAQWIAASVFAGLAIALPGMRIPALLLSAGFAALPLLRHKVRQSF